MRLRRGDIANAINQVRLEAGIGIQSLCPGSLREWSLPQVGPGTPAFSLPLWYLSCYGKAPQRSHVFQSQHTSGFLPVSPRYRQALAEGLQQGGGLYERQVQSHPCTFGSKLQSESTGKPVALLFLLISSLQWEPWWGCTWAYWNSTPNCLCSLTRESIKKQRMCSSVTRFCSLQLKQVLKNARGLWSAGLGQQSNYVTERIRGQFEDLAGMINGC